jgi:nucleotide-binding universal stress UspA family protein
MFLNILVAVDGSPSSLHALREAVDLARVQNSTLTILTVAPPAPPLLPVSGVDPAALRDDVERWAAQVLADAATTVPDDVLLRTVQRSATPARRSSTSSRPAATTSWCWGRAAAARRARGCWAA